MTRGSILCLAGLPLLATTAAHASFVGAAVHLSYVARDGQGASDTFADGTAVAVDELGTSVEFPAFVDEGPTFDVDVDASAIRIDNFFQRVVDSDTFAALPFLGLVFEDAKNAVPPIESVTVVPSPLAMDGLIVTHDADAIELNWQGLGFTPTTRIDLLVTFGGDLPEEVVPEPSLLAANGLFALLLVAKRRNRSTITA